AASERGPPRATALPRRPCPPERKTAPKAPSVGRRERIRWPRRGPPDLRPRPRPGHGSLPFGAREAEGGLDDLAGEPDRRDGLRGGERACAVAFERLRPPQLAARRARQSPWIQDPD